MVGERHFEPGQRAPAPAHHVEGPARRRAFEAGAGHRLGDPAREPRLAFLGERVEPKHAERQRGAAPDPAARDLDQLEAAAAEIAGDPVRIGDGGKHPLSRPLPFLLAGKDARFEAELADAGEEGRAVRGLAHRGGGDDAGAHHLQLPDQQPEAIERGQRPRLRRLPDLADLAAEPGEHLLVEDDRGDALGPGIDDEADRIGADVDDRDGFLREHQPELPRTVE